MHDLKECADRISIGHNQQTRDPLFVCNKVSRLLGWRHGIDSNLCKRCAAHNGVPLSAAVATLKDAIQNGRCDDEVQYESIYHCTRSEIVKRAMKLGVEDSEVMRLLLRFVALSKTEEIANKRAEIAMKAATESGIVGDSDAHGTL